MKMHETKAHRKCLPRESNIPRRRHMGSFR